MTIHKQFRKQLAFYRDLSKAERAELKRRLAGDPAGAELLAEYEAMDERLAALPDPKPDPILRRDFYAALEREQRPGRPALLHRLWQGIPAAAGQLAVAAALVLLVIGAGYLFRQQFEFAAAGTRTPIPTGRPTKAATGEAEVTPVPAEFPRITPTYAVTVPPQDPFGPFREWAAQWPQNTGMTHGALRAGLKEYLRGIGGIGALNDPAAMAELEGEIAGLLPNRGAGLQLADVYPGGEPELVVAILPFVDVVTEDAGGILHIQGVGSPAYWPVESTFPTAVQVQDGAAYDGQPELQVFYTFYDGSRTVQEYLIAKWDPAQAYWQEVLRTATPVEMTPTLPPTPISSPEVTPMTPTPTPDGSTGAVIPIRPIVDMVSLNLDSWSPDGRYLAYWQTETSDGGRPGAPRTLTFYDVTGDETCQYPPDRYNGALPDGVIFGRRYAKRRS